MAGRVSSVKVAVMQSAPVLFDWKATVEKACRLAAEAASQKARLILFPEAFIPAYPRGLSFGIVVGSRKPEGRRTWQRYWENSIEVPGPATEALGEAARQANAYLAIGVIERDSEFSGGTLYCTLLYFGPGGNLLGKHRKLKPTAAERLIWGEGDGSTMPVFDTEIGKIGGLICWENYMPLARMAMYGKGVQIYLAPTADCRDTWEPTLRHIACEGRCFVLGCNQFVTKDLYPQDLPGLEELAPPTGCDLPGRERDHLPPGRGPRRAALRPGRNPVRRPRPGGGGQGQAGLRRRRPLRAAGRLPVDGGREAEAFCGEKDRLIGTSPNAVSGGRFLIGKDSPQSGVDENEADSSWQVDPDRRQA